MLLCIQKLLREDITPLQLLEISKQREPEVRTDADIVVTRMLNEAEETLFSLGKMNGCLNKNFLSPNTRLKHVLRDLDENIEHVRLLFTIVVSFVYFFLITAAK